MVCDVRPLGKPDGETIDALAYAALAARRLGCELVLDGCGRDLCELIELCGLTELLHCRPAPAEGEPSGR